MSRFCTRFLSASGFRTAIYCLVLRSSPIVIHKRTKIMARTKQRSVSGVGATKKKQTRQSSESGSDDDDSAYEVEDILLEKEDHGQTLYLIKWKNFSTNSNTWEPERNLGGAEDTLEKWKKLPDHIRIGSKPKKPFPVRDKSSRSGSDSSHSAKPPPKPRKMIAHMTTGPRNRVAKSAKYGSSRLSSSSSPDSRNSSIRMRERPASPLAEDDEDLPLGVSRNSDDSDMPTTPKNTQISRKSSAQSKSREKSDGNRVSSVAQDVDKTVRKVVGRNFRNGNRGSGEHVTRPDSDEEEQSSAPLPRKSVAVPSPKGRVLRGRQSSDDSGNSEVGEERRVQAGKSGKFAPMKSIAAPVKRAVPPRRAKRSESAEEKTSQPNINDSDDEEEHISKRQRRSSSGEPINEPSTSRALPKNYETKPAMKTEMKKAVEDYHNRSNSGSVGVVNGEEAWTVEEIWGVHRKGRKLYYLVKWDGFDAEENTWEPPKSLVQSQDSVKAFLDKYGKPSVGNPMVFSPDGEKWNADHPDAVRP